MREQAEAEQNRTEQQWNELFTNSTLFGYNSYLG